MNIASELGSRLWWIPQRNLQNQAGDLAMNGEEIELAFPLRIAPDDIWLGLGGIQRFEMSTSVTLPDSGLPVPEQLWDIEFGTMHMRQLLASRLAEERRRDEAQPDGALRQLVQELRRSQIALCTDAANVQHYEVPTEFFRRFLCRIVNSAASCLLGQLPVQAGAAQAVGRGCVARPPANRTTVAQLRVDPRTPSPLPQAIVLDNLGERVGRGGRHFVAIHP